MRTRRQLRRRERGQTLAEFAIILPIVFLLIAGFVDLTRVYNAWVSVEGAAREGARYGVTGQDDCAGATDNRVACIQYLAKQRTKGLANSTDVTVTVRSWDYPDYASPATEGSAGVACDALEVQVDYAFKPAIFTVLFGSVSIKGRERLVNEPWNDCT